MVERDTMETPSHSLRSSRLIYVSMVLSAGLSAGLFWAFWAYASNLALAQSVDSFLDVVTAVGLSFALRISLRPPDDNHQFGHQGAQPIAALVVAVLTGVLAVEVMREAATTLWFGESPLRLGAGLWGAIAIKVLLKAALMGLASHQERRQRSDVLHAFVVDARNDVLLGLTSLVGLIGVHLFEAPRVDSWLALPVGAWIGISGVVLAIRSVGHLMGVAPLAERLAEVEALAAAMPKVLRVAAIKARYHGNEIHVWLDIRVDSSLTIGVAHDVGEAVERRLLEERDICDAVVHVDAG